MSKHKKQETRGWTSFARAIAVPLAPRHIEEAAKSTGFALEAVRHAFAERAKDEIWQNNRYQVVIDRHPEVGPDWPQMIHLSIKRLDKAVIRDWRDLQRIKNELVGPEHEAVELFPADSRLVDSANQYHLWVLADPARRFPFGWTTRFVMNATTNAKSRQRPIRA